MSSELPGRCGIDLLEREAAEIRQARECMPIQAVTPYTL